MLSLHVLFPTLRLTSAQLPIVKLGALLCLTCAISCSTAHAQTAGTVEHFLESSQIPVAPLSPEHRISVISEGTGERRASTSAPNGIYLVALLLPGLYELEIAHSGFKTVKFTHLRITVAETLALNVRLEIGAVSERVTVLATEQLQTESSALGRVTGGEQVRALPLVTRNYSQIIALNPGVAAEVTDAAALGPGFSGPQGPGLVSNGGTIMDNNFQMNGVGINDLQSGGQFTGGIAIPNPDTIQEFKVQTSQYDATFGRNAGANVDVITKSGTREFHGALWEFLRNDLFNANSFFRNKTGQPRPVLKQNQFGLDLGGPIKREKLLFLLPIRAPVSAMPSTPTAPARSTARPSPMTAHRKLLARSLPASAARIKPGLAASSPVTAIPRSRLDPRLPQTDQILIPWR